MVLRLATPAMNHHRRISFYDSQEPLAIIDDYILL